VGHLPDILRGVVPINDLYSIGKVLFNQIPDPFRPISDENELFDSMSTPLSPCQIQEASEILGPLDVSIVANALRS
jgi:hypothetical protein